MDSIGRPQASIKLVIIGDSGVGKTSLRNQYLLGQFSTGYRATIGTDFITKTLPHYNDPDRSVTLQIWDTAGQERFSGLSSAFFRGADAVLLMFDVNRPETLQGLHKWWQEFKARAPVADEDAENFCCVVVGNKTDLAECVQKSNSTSDAGPSRVSEFEAERFLEKLIPRSPDVVDDEYPFEEEDLFFSRSHITEEERQVSIFSLRPSWSGFSLRPTWQGSSMTAEDVAAADIVSPHHPQTSTAIQPTIALPVTKSTNAKSRSSERSLFGGTVASGRTVFHTPSSSLDEFQSAFSTPQSPTHSLVRPRDNDSCPSTPIRFPRRMTSSSSTSSAATITPSLFVRTRATSSASQTPPTPPDPDTSGDYLFTPPPRRRKANLPPRPERGPRLFLASAKTGSGIAPIFEHIARRVQMQWVYDEAVENLRGPSTAQVDTVRLNPSSSIGSGLRDRWSSGSATCCKT